MDKDVSFARKAARKLIENLLSVKVWVLLLTLVLSGVLCWFGKMSGGEFAGLNGGVTSTVFALREGFKVTKIKHTDDKDIMV